MNDNLTPEELKEGFEIEMEAFDIIDRKVKMSSENERINTEYNGGLIMEEKIYEAMYIKIKGDDSTTRVDINSYSIAPAVVGFIELDEDNNPVGIITTNVENILKVRENYTEEKFDILTTKAKELAIATQQMMEYQREAEAAEIEAQSDAESTEERYIHDPDYTDVNWG